MKTPEQIAAEVVRFHRGRPDSQTVANLHGIVAQAIRADRAQRKLPYDTAELQGALDNNDPAQLLEIVNDIHTYQFYMEEEDD